MQQSLLINNRRYGLPLLFTHARLRCVSAVVQLKVYPCGQYCRRLRQSKFRAIGRWTSGHSTLTGTLRLEATVSDIGMHLLKINYCSDKSMHKFRSAVDHFNYDPARCFEYRYASAANVSYFVCAACTLRQLRHQVRCDIGGFSKFQLPLIYIYVSARGRARPTRSNWQACKVSVIADSSRPARYLLTRPVQRPS